MKLKNKIINYFVVPPSKDGGMPRVFRSPVTMNSATAKKLLQKQIGEKLPSGNLLHVCFDVGSERTYVPNASEFTKDKMLPLIQAAQIKITKDFGGFSSHPSIDGSPFSSLRVRSINDFEYAKKAIEKHYEGKMFKNLPVIEVSLAKMPTTLKTLPPEYQGESGYMGGYIGSAIGDSIAFIDEIDNDGRKRKEKMVLLNQKTPFILINMTGGERGVAPTATEKEWVVLNGYRDYLYDQKDSSEEEYIKDDIANFADLYAIKRLLYLGWSFEEVSSYLLRSVGNFGELLKAVQLLMNAVGSLKEEGYSDPSSIHYYITFKIDPKTFPLRLGSIMDMETGKVDPFKQSDNFKILEYDKNNSYILIETPAYICPEICTNILKAIGRPFISKYNPIVDKIDVKTEDKALKDLKRDKVQLAKIKALTKRDIGKTDEDIDFRTGPGASGAWANNPMIFNVRKISDYYYAFDSIKKICQQNNFEFEDFQVVIGPIERVFGSGTQGGFMDEKSFVKSKLSIPHEFEPGLFVSPPVIFINSVTMPSYAEQTDTLVHEYTHHIYMLQHPDYEIQYGQSDPKKEHDYKHWFEYLTDPNERAAHKEQVKFEITLGKSTDEIIRDKIGGRITPGNYPIALKFKELVDEAVEELEKEGEKNEEPS